jgi:SAM-dependent methyltransferase
MLLQEIEQQIGKPVPRLQVNEADFSSFKSRYRDTRSGIDDEKLLEYYIGYTCLDLKPADVFMDIAAQDCPFAFFVRDTIGCRVYRQDLFYLKEGVHGEDVGCDATKLPFPDGALSKIALFNSFEHFEGDNDSLMIKEARRVLRPGGKLCIVPLYIADKYFVEEEAGWVDEKGEKHLWGIGARFARTYDPRSFRERVLQHCPGFTYEVYYLENRQEISPQIHMQYFVIFERQ